MTDDADDPNESNAGQAKQGSWLIPKSGRPAGSHHNVKEETTLDAHPSFAKRRPEASGGCQWDLAGRVN
ncbi:hypothetical protein E4U58_001524 [Claviceps cyperi]|nr:hypothetical protein E4U58_001524 [Claviceps cyperi]